MTASYKHIGIVGAGAWGTALAIAYASTGRSVTLWARNAGLAQTVGEQRENVVYLKGARLSPAIIVTNKMSDLSTCDALVLAVPAQHVRAVSKQLATSAPLSSPIVIAAKGIELQSHKLMSEVVSEELPGRPIFILSGPSFAAEIARGLPAALTLAGETGGSDLAQALSSATVRLYTTDDIVGTQIGGSLKNVLAIACGIVAGRRLGENARAALITRGLAEIMRLGTALGARIETLMGLSGLGDLVLSCSSPQSRNMSLGIALAEGKTLAEVLEGRPGVAEGVTTTTAVLGLAYRHGVDMPVVSAIDRILREKVTIDEIVAELLARPLRHEAS